LTGTWDEERSALKVYEELLGRVKGKLEIPKRYTYLVRKGCASF
jgi:hypothetical protein